MPWPNEREPEMPDLGGLTPEPAGEAPAAFVAAVRARRRVVRARRLSVGAMALVAVVAAWWLAPPAGAPALETAPELAAGGEGPGPAAPGSTLASMRRLYAAGGGEGPVVLPEPARGAVGAAGERPLSLMDTRRVLAGGV